MRTHRGFTLVELMVAMVLTLAVCGVTFKILLTNQQVARTQSEHVGMQDNVRAGGLIVSNELRELGYDSVPAGAAIAGTSVNPGSDLQTIQPGKLNYKAMRAIGFTCAAPTSTQVKLRRSWYYGLRDPLTTDSIALFVDSDASRTDDDGWVHAKITAVTTAGATCTDGSAAIQLTIAFPAGITGATVAGKMASGGPARIFEIMEMQYYVSGGQSWLGMRAVSRGENAPQPMVGPLADSTAGQRGVTFRYWDNTGTATTVAANVRTITVNLRGVSDYAIRTTRNYSTVDTLSMTSTIALRNTLRP
jgi:prepilin-type N-terminal cleavage/methylation domain-containing protein